MHKFGDFVIAMAYVALVLVLVRPGSQGPALVSAFGDSTSGLVKAATGGGTWGSK